MILMERIRKILNEETDVDGAVEIIQHLQYAYNNEGKELVPDETYDELYDFIRRNGVEVVGSTNTGENPVFPHNYTELRGTLDKVHHITIAEKKSKGDNRKSIEEFFNGVERKIGRRLESSDKVYVFIKYDGTSVIEEVEDGVNKIALKRGDTTKNEAEEVPWLRGVKNSFVDKGKYGVKNEIIMTESDFKDFCQVYGNFKTPLSAVSSILNSDDYSDKIQYLTSIPLQVKYADSDMIKYITRDVIPFKDGAGEYRIIDPTKISDVVSAIKDLKSIAEENMIPCDGIVFAFMGEEIQDAMGRENNISKWEVAYKFPSTIYTSTVIDVTYSAGVMGGYTPVVNFEPVNIQNKSIQNASLGSLAIAKQLNLAVGDKVLLRYNIIPTIEGVDSRSGNEPVPIITNCISCGEVIDMDKERCTNINCDIVKIGRIYNHVDKIGVKFFSYKVVEKLYNHGIVRRISDVYTLPASIPVEIGIGRKTYEKIYKNMKDKRELSVDMMLGSLGIEGAGVTMSRNILKQIDYHNLMKAIKFKSISRLSELNKVGTITAENIINGVNEMSDDIKVISKVVKIIEKKESKIPDDAVIAAITKIRDPELVEYLKTKNIYVLDKFTKDTQFVIVPRVGVTSGTTEKALKKGLPIYDIDTIKETSGFNKRFE